MIGGEFVFVFGIEQREATVDARPAVISFFLLFWFCELVACRFVMLGHGQGFGDVNGDCGERSTVVCGF
jgi:hypothetical protein